MNPRRFLMTLGAAAGFPRGAWARQPPARARNATSIYVDAQGWIDGIDRPEPGRYVPRPALIAAIRERRMDLINATVAPTGNGPDRFRDSVEGVASWDLLLAALPTLVTKIESLADIHTARAAGKLGLIYNFQDSTPLEGDVSRVDTFATLGVRVIQLTYNKRNLAGDGCLERANAGLSDFGRELIARINRAGVLLDLSHAGQRTIAEGIAASSAPPAITHSGCRSLTDLPRNTHDAEMRSLAEKGGVLGIYLMPFLRRGGQAGKEDLLRHLDHAVNVCGEDHVGIGTDNPLTGFAINEETRTAHRRFFEDRARRGVAAPGEAPDILNLVEGYNEPDRYDRIGADLERRGWSSTRIGKVLGGNFVRLFGDVWQR